MQDQTVINKTQARVVGLAGILLAVALALGFGLSGLVWADPAGDGSASGGVSAVGSASARIKLTLGTSAVDLTGVDPDCAGVSGTTGYAGSAGNEGCAYKWTVSVKVQSNRAWSGTLTGSDSGSPTSEVRIEDGSFHASTSDIQSYSDCSGATTVPESDDTWTWEAGGDKGVTFATHDQCVIVDWDDDDGSISSTISYSVSQ